MVIRLVSFGFALVLLKSVSAQQCDSGSCYTPKVAVVGMSVQDHLVRDHLIQVVPTSVDDQYRLHDKLHDVGVCDVRTMSSTRADAYAGRRLFDVKARGILARLKNKRLRGR